MNKMVRIKIPNGADIIRGNYIAFQDRLALADEYSQRSCGQGWKLEKYPLILTARAEF